MCPSTIRSNDTIPIVGNNHARDIIRRLILCDFTIDPHFVYDQFSLTHFDPWLRKICNVAVNDLPLNRYKWSIAFDLSEGLLNLRGAFLFVGYISEKNSDAITCSDIGHP